MTDNFECNIDTTCEENPNCCYKQLKRKKQECEELKKANDGILTTIRILAKNNIKLREIISEIKEIAEKVYNDCNACYGDSDTNCDVDCIGCTLGGKAKLAEQILQKISEV